MTSLRLALAQINPTVGDLASNAGRILEFARRADAAGADIVVFPELALTGYPPEDLLLRPAFLKDARKTLAGLARSLPRRLPAVLGIPDGGPGRLFNAAALIAGGRARGMYHKRFLPNYGVFDEKRYFLPGDKPFVFGLKGVGVGLTICEDVWLPGGPAVEAVRAGAGLILNLSSSPYHAGKLHTRLRVLRRKIKETRAALAYCNLVGGQDELVFDGAGLILDARGRTVARAPQFQEHLLLADLPLPTAKKKFSLNLNPARSLPPPPLSPAPVAPLSSWDEVDAALVLGLKDYARKNGFHKAVVGLSGGVDSALVAALAVDALGADNVTGVTMPSRFNSADTQADAQNVARELGIACLKLPIEPLHQEFLKVLAPAFAGRPPDTAEENLQARIRGTLIMALSNKFGWLALTTGNKSETSVGYCTLYGDMAGGFAVIKDVPKTWVYALCRRRNEKAGRAIIPQSVLGRPPSAELRENQTDQDSLPPYDILDKAITLYVEENNDLPAMTRRGVNADLARRVTAMITKAEYKRRQAPPGIKITPLAFGRDRRMPITNRYVEL
jgi:NAD+ synthase (glutamine-hydrolysing)